MKGKSRCVFLLLWGVFCGGPRAADWPMYLGDLLHTSFSPNEVQLNSQNASQLQQIWKVSLASVISTGVTVSGGHLFFGAWDGNFYSVDASTGRVVWKQNLGVSPDPPDPACQPGIGVAGQAVVSGAVVYAGGGDSAVYALDISTGAILWRTPLADSDAGAQIWSSIMLSGNALYVGIASLGDCPLVRSGLARIDLANPSKPAIQYTVPQNQTGAAIWSTPAIDEQANLVYVTTGNANSQDAANGIWGSALLAMDATTLEVRHWFFLSILPGDDDPDFGSSPTLFQGPDGTQLVVANGKNGVMYVAHRPDLSLVWTFKLATDCDAPELGCGSISTPAFDGRTVFAGAGQSDMSAAPPGIVYAIDPATQSSVWVYRAAGIVLGPVTVTPSLVLVPTTAGLSVLDSTTGADLWDDPTGRMMYGQAVLANGTVFTTYTNGDVIAWGLPPGSTPTPLVPGPDELTYTYTLNGTAPAPKTINLASAAGTPAFTISADQPWLSASASSGSAPAVITVTPSVTGLVPGAYSGNVVLQTPGAPSVNVPVQLVVNPPLPNLAPANIVNSATFQSGTLAPGSLFSISAANLGTGTTDMTSVPWPAAYGGISIEINGIRAPLAYLSPTQINAQVPFEVTSGTASLVVHSNGVSSTPVPVTIADTGPGIFMPDGIRAAAQNEDWSENSPGSPATPGSVIVVYFTGQGQGDYPVQSGCSAPFNALVNAVAQSSATIGGQPVQVLFTGLTPGLAGLSQANLVVPDLSPGQYPVVLSIGGVTSNPAVISIGTGP